MADTNNLVRGFNLPCSNVLSSDRYNLNPAADEKQILSDPLRQRPTTRAVAKPSLLGPQPSLCLSLARSQHLQKDRQHCCMMKISSSMRSLFSHVVTGNLLQSDPTAHQCVDRDQSLGEPHPRQAKKSGAPP